MSEEYGTELSKWFANQTQYKTKSELARALNIPRETFNSYLRGTVDLKKVNPENLKKLYELTKIEHFNIPAEAMNLTRAHSNKSSQLEKFAFNPVSDARDVGDKMVDLVVTLFPYQNADPETRKRLITELSSRGGETFAYLKQLVGILEQEGDINQWLAVSKPPVEVKRKLEDRYGP